jgi:transcription termination/antitermination protein NusG
MPRPIHEGKFRARATFEHFATLNTEIPIPKDRRNVVPAALDGLRWYVCTTFPQAERRAAESLRREAGKLADRGLEPFVPYAPCSTEWRDRQRGSLKLPRLEVQTPLLRSYLFVGIKGGIDDGHLGVLSERDVERQNKHGLIAVLGRAWERQPVALDDADVKTLADWADEERATDAPPPPRGFQAGETVVVRDGPLNGFRGTVEAIDAVRGRMLVQMALLGSLTPVELNFEQAMAA